MAYGLPGVNFAPLNYSGSDGILFHLQDDMSSFLKLSSTTEMRYQSVMNVSQHPVMSGANVADNQSRQPKTLSITGVVVVGYEGAFFQTQNTSVVEDFITTVERWRDQKQLVRVICKDGVQLSNAIISSFSASKNKEISNGLNVEIAFTGIDIVKEAQKVRVKTGGNANGSKAGSKTKDGAVQGKKSLGSQATKTTSSTDACKQVLQLKTEGDKASNIRRLKQGCNMSYTQFIKPDGSVGISFSPSANAASQDFLNQQSKNPVVATGHNVNRLRDGGAQ